MYAKTVGNADVGLPTYASIAITVIDPCENPQIGVTTTDLAD